MGILRWAGRTALLCIQVLAGVLGALGANGTTSNGPAPMQQRPPHDDYRP
ncbi:MULTISPECIES: hypothetical protein [unclassified Curtobacterium]|nr:MULTISPECIES: hypothetical protein [unclassified Curtobacterium]ROP66086.1 hypothetical protein EDF55_0536 [Curtobacterium sp. ZW137]TCK60185.1 hypothetical protein EDF27_3287 [Curtobacterium sp. PhB136]